MSLISGQGSLASINSSSPRSRINYPSCRISRLFSPNQAQRTSAYLNPVDHGEDGNGTQVLLSAEPSNPASISIKAKNAQPASLASEARRATHWKTVGMIVGLLFAGQSPLARDMTVNPASPSFCPRALPACQELGRCAYRQKLPYTIPDLCSLYPLDYDL
jgi:hypothetical protein